MPNDIRPPKRGFSFRDFSASKPNQPLPGDRLDMELDRINLTLAQFEAFLLTSFERDGLLKTRFLSETLRQPLQEAQASIGTSISSARIAEDMAYRWASKLDGPVFVPNGGDPVDDGFYSAKFHALKASTSAAAIASQWADIKTWHFEVSTVFYPETKALHRHFFSTYYGPFDFPPTEDPFGDPITPGDLYFNTSVGAMFVWDGDNSRWEAFSGASVSSFLDLTDTPKSYADQASKMVVVGPQNDRLLFEDAFRQPQADARYLPFTGGTLTGPLTLPGNPAEPLHAVTKGYTDSADAALGATLTQAIDDLEAATALELARKLNLTGGTLTGPLTLSGDPAQPLQAAPKQYVDAQIAAIPPPAVPPTGIPIGTVSYFAGTAPPADWIICDGSQVTQLHPDLRTHLLNQGSPFGTAGGNPLRPDLRGEFIRGWDGTRGVDAGRVFGSRQLDQLQRFSGNLNDVQIIGGAEQTIGIVKRNVATNSAIWQGSVALPRNVRFDIDTLLDPTIRSGAETRPRNVALLPCIKAANAVALPPGTAPQEVTIAAGASGWQVVGDQLICWGAGNSLAGGSTTIAFPRVFKAAPVVIPSSINNPPAPQLNLVASHVNPSPTGAVILTQSNSVFAGGIGFIWIAIGEARDEDKKPKVVGGAGGAASADFASVAEARAGVRPDAVLSPATVQARKGSMSSGLLTGKTAHNFMGIPPQATRIEVMPRFLGSGIANQSLVFQPNNLQEGYVSSQQRIVHAAAVQWVFESYTGFFVTLEVATDNISGILELVRGDSNLWMARGDFRLSAGRQVRIAGSLGVTDITSLTLGSGGGPFNAAVCELRWEI